MIPTRQTDWPLVALLFLTGLFAAAQFAKFSLTLPDLRLAYAGLGDAVSVLVSLVGIVGIALGAVAGSLVARAGVRRALVTAIATGAALSVLQALMPPFWLLAGSRVLEGMSHLAIVVATPTLMASISADRDRPMVMGIWAMFFGVSFALCALAFPPLIAFGGLPLIFALHGAGFGIIALVLAPRLPKPTVAPVPREGFLREHHVIYSSPRLIAPGAGFVWYTFLYIALLAVLPPLMTASGWQVAGLPLVSLFGTFAGGVLARHVAPHRIAVAGFALTAGTTILLLATGSIWAALVMMLVMGLVPGASFAAIPHFNAGDLDRARATGGIAQLGNVGTTLGTPVLVVTASIGGLAGVGIVTLACCGAGIAMLLWISRKIR